MDRLDLYGNVLYYAKRHVDAMHANKIGIDKAYSIASPFTDSNSYSSCDVYTQLLLGIIAHKFKVYNGNNECATLRMTTGKDNNLSTIMRMIIIIE